jgi:hypothetical protein
LVRVGLSCGLPSFRPADLEALVQAYAHLGTARSRSPVYLAIRDVGTVFQIPCGRRYVPGVIGSVTILKQLAARYRQLARWQAKTHLHHRHLKTPRQRA